MSMHYKVNLDTSNSMSVGEGQYLLALGVSLLASGWRRTMLVGEGQYLLALEVAFS